jgi:acetyl esterase/lipase
MPVHDWSHADFPESTATADGLREIEADPPYGRRVLVHPHVEYAVKDGRALHLVVLQPGLDPGTGAERDIEAEAFPLVVYVQGSAWREQQLGSGVARLSGVARRGFVIAVVEYRPSSVAPFPAQVADALTATRWLLDHAGEFHIDPRRVAMWGDSSGGHTTLMAAVAGHEPDFTDEPDRPPVEFACFVDFYGPVALDRMEDEPTTMAHNALGSPESDLFGGREPATVPDLVRRADPRSHITADRPLPPVLIAHGSKDPVVPFAQSILGYEALRAAGQPVEMVKVRGAAHGGVTFWTDELMDLVAGFLRRHLTG